QYRLDSSNRKNDYLRNRIRSDLIPHLESGYNPNLKTNILQTINILREEDRYLDELASQHLSECGGRVLGKESFFLKISQFNQIPPTLQKRLIRQAILHVKGNLRRITAKHIQDVMPLYAEEAQGKTLHLPGPIEVRNTGNRVEFRRIKNLHLPSNILNMCDPDSRKTCLNIPGETRIPGTSLKFIAQVVGHEKINFREAHANQAYLDFNKTGELIHARYFLPGDRFVPLGMTGRKKLKSFLIDAKVPQEERKSIPVLTTENNDIIWVYGKRISQSHRVTQETRKILLIEGVSC
ncbi:MAG: tRNA lysidine(34) synthetase TilS, partial [Nitrospinales bacterium]